MLLVGIPEGNSVSQKQKGGICMDSKKVDENSPTDSSRAERQNPQMSPEKTTGLTVH